ncbi:hypothetical protein BKA65DRAFT_262361 [Rhexocercosporidium sp. MPI-PUGE-AT-0058]|nr:hypothetical protein BKA65DRAFT_262361 [Rhexocercosporidium sp. MPI-PUGE-AT-0058]
MVYRRSMTSIDMNRLPSVSEAESSSDIAMLLGPRPETARQERAKKRNTPHDEETEMALFRRVRIKAQVKVRNPVTPPSRSRHSSPPRAPLHPAMNRRSNLGASGGATAGFREVPLPPTPKMLPKEPEDPYADPELQRMLQEDELRKFELDEILEDVTTDMDMDSNIDPDAELALNQMDYDERMEEDPDEWRDERMEMHDWQLYNEIEEEAAVDREINDRMLRDQLPDSEFESEDGSEEMSEDESEKDPESD